MLNLVSPSDGKSNNMFGAIYNKYINSNTIIAHNCTNYLHILQLVSLPFTMAVDIVESIGTTAILLNITLSHTGKVVCATSHTNSLEQVEWEKTREAYLRAGISTSVRFSIPLSIQNGQYLHCMGMSLQQGVNETRFYSSKLFYIQGKCNYW